MRRALHTSLLLLAACGNAHEGGAGSTGDGASLPGAFERRHVLLLTVDTLRWDHLSRNGHPDPTTPALDALMARSVVFERALAPVGRTTPSLATLLTGRYPQEHQVRTLFDRLKKQVPTLAMAARQAGYRTLAVVTNNVLDPKRGLGRGFDVYDQAGNDRQAAATTATAIEHLEQVYAGQPVLLWVHYIDPHVPYRPPPEYAAAFAPGYTGPYATHFGDTFEQGADAPYPAELGKRRAVFENPLDESTNAHIRKLYAADVRGTDDAIGELLRTIDGRPDEDWTVVFTADHGEALGEHDYFWDHGDYVWLTELHVPLAFRFAERDPLHRVGSVDTWVSLADVTPTLVELLALDWPADPAAGGRSLMPAIRGDAQSPRPVFGECGRSFFFDEIEGRVSNDVAGRFRTVVLGDDKLVWTPGAAEGAYRLYDIAADPTEQHDLAASRPEKVAALARHLERWVAGDAPGPRSEPDAEDLEQLEALGYVAGDEE